MTTAALDKTMVRGARWSYASKCVRMACLHMNGEQPADDSPEMRGYQLRGHLYEDHVALQLTDMYGVGSFTRQEQIEWPHGTIHADFYLPGERLIVEHKSRSSLDATDADWLQLAGQIHYHPEATRGELWITHPVNPLEQRRLPFELTEWWKARVVHVAHQISERAKRLPDRICSHPTEATKHFCKFAIPCFDDWAPPEPLTLPGGAEDLARRLWHVEQLISEAGSEEKTLREQRDQLREELAGYLDNGADYTVAAPGGQIRVRRTVSADGTTYDMKAALAAGVVDEKTLRPFRKVRKGAERWTVTASGNPTTETAKPF